MEKYVGEESKFFIFPQCAAHSVEFKTFLYLLRFIS